MLTEFEQNCRSLGLQPVIIEVAAAEEFDNAITEMLRQRAQALLVQADGLFYGNRVALLNAALNHALPTIVAEKVMLGDGALVYYGITDAELSHRNAAFVDRILRGAKPAELPIEQPAKFELGINMKTAKALGIIIPRTLLLRANEVIQ